MDQRQTQARLVRAVRAGRRRSHDRVDAGLSDHAVQGADAAHDGDLLPDAALVSTADGVGFARDSHVGDRVVVWRALVESRADVTATRANTRRDVAGATETFRVDVQSTAESRLCETRRRCVCE